MSEDCKTRSGKVGGDKLHMPVRGCGVRGLRSLLHVQPTMLQLVFAEPAYLRSREELTGGQCDAVTARSRTTLWRTERSDRQTRTNTISSACRLDRVVQLVAFTAGLKHIHLAFN